MISIPKLNDAATRRRTFVKTVKANADDFGGISGLSAITGISRSTLYRRNEDPDSFTVSELRSIIRVGAASPKDILLFLGFTEAAKKI